MHLFSMDQSSWYTCKEMYSTNFNPYYNSEVTNTTSYYYYKNIPPYTSIEQVNNSFAQQYHALTPENETGKIKLS